MQKITSLSSTIQADHKQFSFAPDNDFRWSPDEQTIYLPPIKGIADIWQLLHELGHACLSHERYDSDIQLLQMEVDAWSYARATLATSYNLKIPDEYIDKHLDTYRDWLHQRSLCPHCGQTGIQSQQNRYKCLNCSGLWQVNDARKSQLRRTIV